MSSTSQIPVVLDALVALLTTTLAPLEVRDGPPTIQVPTSGLYIGATDEDNTIDFMQGWGPMGAKRRDESFQIPNLLLLRTGDQKTNAGANNLSTVRSAIFTTLGLIETALRADIAIGTTTNTVRVEFGTPGSFTQLQTGDGVVCRIRFTFNVNARI